VRPLVRSKTWDTRVAAGECIGRLAEHFCHHTPEDLKRAAASGADADNSHARPSGTDATDSGLLSFANFDIEQVLQQGTVLLASGGQASRSMSFVIEPNKIQWVIFNMQNRNLIPIWQPYIG
jgi:hypothetical protein